LPAQPHGGDESLSPQLARIEPAAKVIEGGAIVLIDPVADCVDKDQVTRPLEACRHANVGLALAGPETLRREYDGLVCLQSFADSRVQDLDGATVDILLGRSTCQAHSDLVERQQEGTVLDELFSEAIALGRGWRHDHEQAPGRVADEVRWAEHPAANRDGWGSGRLTIAARAIRGPAPPLVIGDLHAARARFV